MRKRIKKCTAMTGATNPSFSYVVCFIGKGQLKKRPTSDKSTKCFAETCQFDIHFHAITHVRHSTREAHDLPSCTKRELYKLSVRTQNLVNGQAILKDARCWWDPQLYCNRAVTRREDEQISESIYDLPRADSHHRDPPRNGIKYHFQISKKVLQRNRLSPTCIFLPKPASMLNTGRTMAPTTIQTNLSQTFKKYPVKYN